MGFTQHPYLNLGCGKVTLPCPKPRHHGIIPDGVHDYALWTNVDRHNLPGVEMVFDVFQFPWPLGANSHDGALLSHIVEHIPHSGDRDGFYGFFDELARVLTNEAVVHVIAPYAFSTGAVQDPTHTRLLVPETFDYLRADESAPFRKECSGWAVEDVRFELTSHAPNPNIEPEVLQRALRTRWNIASDFYVRLRLSK